MFQLRIWRVMKYGNPNIRVRGPNESEFRKWRSMTLSGEGYVNGALLKTLLQRSVCSFRGELISAFLEQGAWRARAGFQSYCAKVTVVTRKRR